MDLDYKLSRHKVPRGFSYPLKRDAFDTVISARGVQSIKSLVLFFRRIPTSTLMEATYSGEQNGGLLAGTFSIWIYAVPSTKRSAIQELIMQTVLPPALDWITEIDRAGNVRRMNYHYLSAQLIDGEVVINGD
jgi:hypothetical protein